MITFTLKAIVLVFFAALSMFFGFFYFATFVHEIYHYKTACKYNKCDTIILLRTRLFKGIYTKKWQDGRQMIVKLVPKIQWSKFDMEGCMGRTHLSNEYIPYSNRELVDISRAGLIGSYLGYLMPSLGLGITFGMMAIISNQMPGLVLIIATACFLIIYMAFCFAKRVDYKKLAKNPGWSDGAIELDPDGYRRYLENLDVDGAHTYHGVIKLL
jgi:hypothetical protein